MKFKNGHSYIYALHCLGPNTIAHSQLLQSKQKKKKKGNLLKSLVAQIVMNLPAMQETRVRSLGWEDPLRKRLPTPWKVFLSSVLAWIIPWTEEPGRLQSMGVTKSQT